MRSRAPRTGPFPRGPLLPRSSTGWNLFSTSVIPGWTHTRPRAAVVGWSYSRLVGAEMRVSLAFFLVSWLAAAPALGITGGQVDDFQDGTTQGWSGMSAPTNVATGGPDGTGDRYLQISSATFHL